MAEPPPTDDDPSMDQAFEEGALMDQPFEEAPAGTEAFGADPSMDDALFNDPSPVDGAFDGGAGEANIAPDSTDDHGMDTFSPQDDIAQDNGFQDLAPQNAGAQPGNAGLYDGAEYGDDFENQPDNGALEPGDHLPEELAFEDPSQDLGAEGSFEQPDGIDEEVLDACADDLPQDEPLQNEPDSESIMENPAHDDFQGQAGDDFASQSLTGGGQGDFDQYDDHPGNAEPVQSFDEPAQDGLAQDGFAEPSLDDEQGFRNGLADPNAEAFPTSPPLDPQDSVCQSPVSGEAMMSPLPPPTPPMEGMNGQPMSPGPQYDGSEYGPLTPPPDDEAPPLPSSPFQDEMGFDDRGNEHGGQFEEPPPQEDFDDYNAAQDQDQGMAPLDDQFQESLPEDDLGPQNMNQQGLDSFEERGQYPDDGFNGHDATDMSAVDNQMQGQPFDGNLDRQGDHDMVPSDEAFQEQEAFQQQPYGNSFNGQNDHDMLPLDEQLQEEQFGSNLNEQQGEEMILPHDGYPQQPMDDSFAGQDGRDIQSQDEQYQEPLFDNFDTSNGQETPPSGNQVQDQPLEDSYRRDDGRDVGPQEEYFDGDILPEFPAPQGQNDFDAARPSPIQQMQQPETTYQEYPYPQEPAQEVYYDPDVPASPPQQYQPNNPMEMVSTNDEYPDQPNFVAIGSVPGRPAGMHKNEKYQWLLPLLSTATLGWGVEALEEQYHAANLKASGFTFKALAAKLFGPKKSKNDASNDRNRRKVSAAGVMIDEDGNPIDQNGGMGNTEALPVNPTGEMNNEVPQDPTMVDQNGEWEDIDEIESHDRKKGKRGLFGLLRNKKKNSDLETQDQLQEDQDPTMEDSTIQNAQGPVMMDAPMGGDGFPDDSDAFDPNADPTADEPKKRGFFAGLFGGKKKGQDLEAQTMETMDNNMNPNNGDNTYMDRDADAQSGYAGIADTRDMSQAGMGAGEMDSQYDANQPPKKQGFFARLFGKKSKHQRTEVHNTGSHSFDDGYNTPPKKGGMFAVFFSSNKKSTAQNQETYHMETSPRIAQSGNESIQDQYPREPDSEMYPNTEVSNLNQKPKKKGFFAALFKSKKNKSSTDDTNQPPKQRGLFARLFRRKPKTTNGDIEMGNMADASDEARVGRVRTGSPQLVQGESDARQSATADVMDSHDDNFEDVPDKKSKKKKSKKEKKAKKQHGMGLFHQGSLAGKRKKGDRQSGVFENEDGDVVTKPREVRKGPAKVRYAPIAPSSEGMYRQVNAPKQRQRGVGRTTAAAVNPGNWFWMDVYWK